MRTRWKVLSGPIVAATAATALLFWGVAVEPRLLLDTEEEVASIPNLPPAWEGQEVALIGDFQIGMWWDNPGMVARAVQETVERRPSIVLIAGDLVYEADSTVVEEAIEIVRPLAEAGVPTFVVLGNHDYGLSESAADPDTTVAAYLEQQLAREGIVVLENESAVVDRNGTPLYVAGIGSEWADRARPAAAISDIPSGAARIVFMHNPVAYRDLPPSTAPAAFAAHTHGGQIRIPWTDSKSWLNIALPREVVADGWSEKDVGANGNRLYVNRGVGFSLLPIRLFCRPELTFFTLTSAADDPSATSR